MAKSKLTQYLEAYLTKHCEYDEANKCWYDEAYADYSDTIDDETAAKILDSENPEMTLEEMMMDWYVWAESEVVQNHIKALKATFKVQAWPDDQIEEAFYECWYFKLPLDHYLSQKVCINLKIDTGDANADYSLNATYPHYNGQEDEPIDDKASLVWLAQQQGYSKEQLQNALLTTQDNPEQHGFLPTVYQEILNCSAPLPALIFPVSMTLREACKLAKIIHNRDVGGYEYDVNLRKDCGSVVLDKKVEPLLYDAWAGGGSCWGIELDKDVEIPIKYIANADPDGATHWSIHECYGTTNEFWRNCLKAIKE